MMSLATSIPPLPVSCPLSTERLEKYDRLRADGFTAPVVLGDALLSYIALFSFDKDVGSTVAAGGCA